MQISSIAKCFSPLLRHPRRKKIFHLILRWIATELGVGILATTEVIKQWAEIVNPSAAELSTVLESIE